MVVTHYTAARRWTFQLHKECDQNNEESRGGLGMNKICVCCESVLICVYMFIYMSVHSIAFYPAPTFSQWDPTITVCKGLRELVGCVVVSTLDVALLSNLLNYSFLSQ